MGILPTTPLLFYVGFASFCFWLEPDGTWISKFFELNLPRLIILSSLRKACNLFCSCLKWSLAIAASFNFFSYSSIVVESELSSVLVESLLELLFATGTGTAGTSGLEALVPNSSELLLLPMEKLLSLVILILVSVFRVLVTIVLNNIDSRRFKAAVCLLHRGRIR